MNRESLANIDPGDIDFDGSRVISVFEGAEHVLFHLDRVRVIRGHALNAIETPLTVSGCVLCFEKPGGVNAVAYQPDVGKALLLRRPFPHPKVLSRVIINVDWAVLGGFNRNGWWIEWSIEGASDITIRETRLT